MFDTIELYIHISRQFVDLSNFVPIGYMEGHCYINGINYVYNYRNLTLKIKVTTYKVLGKLYSTLSDYDEFINGVVRLFNVVVKDKTISKKQIFIKRIDMKVDCKLTDMELILFKQIKDKHYSNYKYMSKKQDYETSVHLNNSNGQYNFNSYDKYEQSKNMDFWNIWRIEVQCKKSMLRKNYIRDGLINTLDNYWSIDGFNEYFFQFLTPYFNKGDYYRLDVARDLIRKSNYSKTIKNNLCKFVTRINRYGMTGVKGKYYNYVTMKKYCELLDNIGVNPVTIDIGSNPTYMENILKKAKKIVEEKYFV